MADRARPSAVLYASHIRRDAIRDDFDLLVTLDFEARFLRRKRMVTDCGTAFTVDLAETVSLNSNDAFVLEDGRQIIIKAAVELITEIRHAALAKIAWHLGNRHTPCEISEECLKNPSRPRNRRSFDTAGRHPQKC